MALTVESYDRRHLEAMSRLYNDETALEGHIASLSPERFVELVERKSYFDPEGLLVAHEAGELVGWVHACVAPGSEPHHDPRKPVGQIRMLVYRRDRLSVGRVLVSEATAWLKSRSDGPLLAMHAQHGYPFYRGLWLGGEPMCPATMPHLQLAFEVEGYKNTQESIFMVAEMPTAPGQAPANAPVELEEAPAAMAHEPMRESWVGFEPMMTGALLRGEEVASIAWVVLPHVADKLGAPAMSIWGLGVREEHRRKGIATALISHAMASAHALGARFASVGTQLWNSPAHASYAKLGFVPHCVLVGRTLSRQPA